MIDMTLMAKLIVAGPGAAAVLSRLSANDVTREAGRLVYTQWLNTAGGIIADVTVTRLGEEKFLVVASDIIHRRIEPLVRRETRPGEIVTVTDVTSGTTLLTVQGPASRELISRLTDADLSNEAFPYLSARQVHVGYAPVLAMRVTYVGELGWELHMPAEYAAGVYDDLMAAGAELGIRPVGLSAMSSLRLEKGYRDMGVDIDNTDNPIEAGLGFAVAWDKPGGFVGRDALLGRAGAGPPRHRVVGLIVDDPAADLFGNEPVLLDGDWVGYVRAAAYGYTRRRPGRAGPGGLRGRRDGRVAEVRRLRGQVRRAGLASPPADRAVLRPEAAARPRRELSQAGRAAPTRRSLSACSSRRRRSASTARASSSSSGCSRPTTTTGRFLAVLAYLNS